jgi:hypothetical protein
LLYLWFTSIIILTHPRTIVKFYQLPGNKKRVGGSVRANLEILQKMRDAVDYTLKKVARQAKLLNSCPIFNLEFRE